MKRPANRHRFRAQAAHVLGAVIRRRGGAAAAAVLRRYTDRPGCDLRDVPTEALPALTIDLKRSLDP